jgi:prephenate dehydrogenase
MTMTTTIGIVGLGQIGASIGLALKAKRGPERILGHDRNSGVQRTARGLGAVDAVGSLKDAVKDAQIVFLCLPLGEIREALSRIGPHLNENAVVLDTAPIKGKVVDWVREFIPQGRYYVGLVPTVNPDLLAKSDIGIKAAEAELFQRTTMMVVTLPDTPAGVEQLAMNIARLLGAKPMLTDPVEADGIMTTAHLLPQLAAAALIESSLAPGGWGEARKLAGGPFSTGTASAVKFDDPVSVKTAALSNSARVVHGLDVLIASLQGLREAIESGDDKSVVERLLQSQKGRAQWLEERLGAKWLMEGNEPVNLPGLSQQITQMFFGGRIADVTSNIAGKLEGKQ